MIVSVLHADGTSKSVLRGGHKCFAHRNMDFIEIEYEKNGKLEWFRILPGDMQRLLEQLPNYKSENSVELILQYDEDITPEMEKRWLEEAFGLIEGKQEK